MKANNTFGFKNVRNALRLNINNSESLYLNKYPPLYLK